MEFQIGGMLENWMDRVIDRSEQQGTWSCPEGDP